MVEELRQFILSSTCRVCQSEALHPIVSLGLQKIVDFVDAPGISEKPTVPLELVLCSCCKLVQLRHTTNPKFLYPTFWYRSGINEQMRAALLDIVMKSYHKANIKHGDVVCDIGCNDGTMLDLFPKEVITVGFDPSNQLATSEAKCKMNYAINNYFNREDAVSVVTTIGKRFKLVTAIAMFYDLPDPAEFLSDVRHVLADDGIIVIQMNYLLSMLKQNAFDNVCHEHLTYFSLTSLRWLLTRCGFDVMDVETNDINGGSFRVYIKRTPLKREDIMHGGFDRVRKMLEEEKEYGLDKVETYTKFGKRVNSILQSITKYIIDLVANGNIVYGYGASTRGTVLLNATEISLPLVGVAERDQNKFGKYMVAGWLPIYNEDYVRSRCKYMLVLPWHFKESIVAREQSWIQEGGTLIFPMGDLKNGPHIVNKDGEKSILLEGV